MLVLKSSKDALLKPLQAVAGVVERKHTLPILSNVLVEVMGGRAAFVATDLELQITTWAEEQGAADTSLTVSARKLLDICRSLPDIEPIALDLPGSSSRSSRAAAASACKPCRPGISRNSRYPRARACPSACPRARSSNSCPGCNTPWRSRTFATTSTACCSRCRASASPSRPPTAIAWRWTAPNWTRRSVQGVDVILPRKTVLELGKLLGEGDDPVHIQVNQSQVVFRRPDFELRSKVVDGKFPDWQRVIPVGHDKRFVMQRQRLSQSLARAAILTNDKYRGVRVALTAGSLRIACSNNEQEEAQEELDIDYSGEPLDIGFNVQYLQDVLNNLTRKPSSAASGIQPVPC
jgi:DNA polymerase-3 subunit beta